MRGQKLTLGLLRGLVDRPEDAPLIDRDLHKHTASGQHTYLHLSVDGGGALWSRYTSGAKLIFTVTQTNMKQRRRNVRHDVGNNKSELENTGNTSQLPHAVL